MKLVIAALTAAACLAGCAGTDSQMRVLENSNAVRVDQASPGLPYDYVVSVRNVKDIGYDPDTKETRDDMALRMMRDQCPGARIFGETVINTGQFLLGNPARTYAIQIKCR